MTLLRLDSGSPDFAAQLEQLTAWQAEHDHEVNATVTEILADVATRGDAAVLEYTARFDRLAAARSHAPILKRFSARGSANISRSGDSITIIKPVNSPKAIENVGPMDERFFIYWEDADWCKRMWVAGWKVIYCPMVTVVHYVGGSSVKLPFRSNFEFHKNCYRLYSKYAGFPLKVISPLVFGGIAMRFFFVLAAHKLKNYLNRRSMGKAPYRSSY